ncbi:MAG: hypothetical protein ISP91_13575 [Pseudomonadales bacterium]|nr:hypothetical protein [Pseudomonadales bacterium]
MFRVMRCGLAALLLALASAGAAANTSSVFSPDVDDGEREFEYRASYVPEDGAIESAFSHRLHYQHAFDDTWRIRLIGSQNRRGDNSLTYNYTRLELQQQYLEDEKHGWDAAVRYELQISDRSDRPDRVRLAWTAKWDINEDWQLRGNVLLGRQFGENAGSGALVETRSQITRKLGSLRLGLEMFNDLNRTTDFGDWEEQGRQIGPVVKFRAGNLSVFGSYLVGVSSSAEDENFRMLLTYPL